MKSAFSRGCPCCSGTAQAVRSDGRTVTLPFRPDRGDSREASNFPATSDLQALPPLSIIPIDPAASFFLRPRNPASGGKEPAAMRSYRWLLALVGLGLGQA